VKASPFKRAGSAAIDSEATENNNEIEKQNTVRTFNIFTFNILSYFHINVSAFNRNNKLYFKLYLELQLLQQKEH